VKECALPWKRKCGRNVTLHLFYLLKLSYLPTLRVQDNRWKQELSNLFFQISKSVEVTIERHNSRYIQASKKNANIANKATIAKTWKSKRKKSTTTLKTRRRKCHPLEKYEYF